MCAEIRFAVAGTHGRRAVRDGQQLLHRGRARGARRRRAGRRVRGQRGEVRSARVRRTPAGIRQRSQSPRAGVLDQHDIRQPPAQGQNP